MPGWTRLANATVLLVEDDPVNRTLLRLFLQRLGTTVLEAGEGRPGVALAAEAHAGLVDLSLPDIDGIEVVTRIRAAGHALPLVALTGEVRTAELQRARDAGCNDVLGKPINLEVVCDTPERLLDPDA